MMPALYAIMLSTLGFVVSRANDNTTSTSHVIYKREKTDCPRADDYRCQDGHCLEKDQLCDTVVDCPDASDEMSDTCRSLNCQGDQFTCLYGACVDYSLACDGKLDCWDGSDELCKETSYSNGQKVPIANLWSVYEDLAANQPQPPDTSRRPCKVPEQVNNTRFYAYFSRLRGVAPGSLIAHETSLVATCDSGYADAWGERQLVTNCTDGEWFDPFPLCTRVCPRLKSNSLEFWCSTATCTSPGTVVTFQCRILWELPESTLSLPKRVRCNDDGQWSGQMPHCVPSCGIPAPTINNEPSTTSDFVNPELIQIPWKAAIYHVRWGERKAVCGGTLISTRHVLTAAHCVMDTSLVPASTLPVNSVTVALGRYFWSVDVPENTTRMFGVDEVKLPPDFSADARSYANDIALLVLDVEVLLWPYALPACLDLNNSYANDLVSEETPSGHISGWGIGPGCLSHMEECKVQSDTLRHTQLPIVSRQECKRLSRPAREQLTEDKFCTVTNSDPSFQYVDDGAGLTVPFNGKHYVVGIVSTRFTSDSSTSTQRNHIIGFTNVSHHMHWLATQMKLLEGDSS